MLRLQARLLRNVLGRWVVGTLLPGQRLLLAPHRQWGSGVIRHVGAVQAVRERCASAKASGTTAERRTLEPLGCSRSALQRYLALRPSCKGGPCRVDRGQAQEDADKMEARAAHPCRAPPDGLRVDVRLFAHGLLVIAVAVRWSPEGSCQGWH